MASSGHSGVPRNLRQRCRIFPGASWKAATALPGRNDGFVGTLLAPREVVTALSHLLGCFPEGGDSAAGAKGWFLRNSPGSPGSCDSAVAFSRGPPGRQRQSCRSEVMVFRVPPGSPGSCDSAVASSWVPPRRQPQRWRSEGMAVSDPLGSPGSCDSAVASSRVPLGRQRQRCRSEIMASSGPSGPPGSCDSAVAMPTNI